MGTTNYELERQIAVCKEAIEEAKQTREDFNARYKYLLEQINIRTAEKKVLVDKGYGVNDSRRAKFTGCTAGGIGGRKGGCISGPEHNGGNVYDDGGYYARNRLEIVEGCGGLDDAWNAKCSSGVFDGTVCHNEVLQGCLQTLHQEKQWTYLTIPDITYSSQPIGNASCHYYLWDAPVSNHKPMCSKTTARINQENSELAQLQREIDDFTSQINNLRPPTVNFDCRICNSSNSINCTLGATCTELTQASSCIQGIEDAYIECKSKGGIYDSNTKQCNMPVNCVMNPWSDWSTCSQKCGSGNQTRERTIKTQPMYGGTACPTNTRELRTCQDNSQCPDDCQVEWKPEGTCSATCGVGNQKYIGNIVKQAQFNGRPCPTLLEKNDRCENYSGCVQDNTTNNNNNSNNNNNNNNNSNNNNNNNNFIKLIVVILLIIPVFFLL